jgi:hypothetical protein
MNTGKLVLGIVAGAAAGALLGVLFAPEKGTMTRKRIRCKEEDLRSDLKDKIDEFVDSIINKFNQVKKDMTEFSEKEMDKENMTEKDLNTVKK